MKPTSIFCMSGTFSYHAGLMNVESRQFNGFKDTDAVNAAFVCLQEEGNDTLVFADIPGFFVTPQEEPFAENSFFHECKLRQVHQGSKSGDKLPKGEAGKVPNRSIRMIRPQDWTGLS